MHLILVAARVLLWKHEAIMTVIAVMSPDDSDHTRGLVVIHFCTWLCTYRLGLYTEMLI
jgi:hypothetical protein